MEYSLTRPNVRLEQRSSVAAALLALILVLMASLGSGEWLAGALAAQAQPPANAIALVAPSECPAGGCAAGQRLSVRAAFALAPATNRARACVYTPTAWASSPAALQFDPAGGTSTAPYTPGAACPTPPEGYALLGGAAASLTPGAAGDTLGFSLRIGPSAAAAGALLVTLEESADAGNTWGAPVSITRAIPVAPLAAQVYVANLPAGCGANSPCYVDSAGDQEGGLGTGLKDAVDAQATSAAILIGGTYAIKSQAVTVQHPHSLQGVGDATLTGSGGCGEPLLLLTGAASVRGLNITGGCPAPGRDLIWIDHPANGTITIESNDLTAGKDAIVVKDHGDPLVLRFNHITGSSGYALRWEFGSGQVETAANNLFGNRSGAQVDCGGQGVVDHNYWGPGVLPAQAAANCTADPDQRLGAPVVQRTNAPGVDAAQITVTTAKTYALNNQVAAQRSEGGADVGLVVVNHGSNTPFLSGATAPLTACTPYWDVFLAPGQTVQGSLDLFFKYDQNSGCAATISSTYYCGQIEPVDAARLPLYWLDPSDSMANQWVTTGSTGQATRCLAEPREIAVTVDSSGRPNLLGDLKYVPFVVGLPSAPGSVVFSKFTAAPGDGQITLEWATTTEINATGYYVNRLNPSTSAFERISPLIPAAGQQSGASYSYTDPGLANGTSYTYRLEVVNLEQTSLVTGALTATPGVPTPTPTTTGAITQTPVTATFTAAPTTATPGASATQVTAAATTLVAPTQTTATQVTVTQAATTGVPTSITRTVTGTSTTQAVTGTHTPTSTLTLVRSLTPTLTSTAPTGTATLTSTVTTTLTPTFTITITRTATLTWTVTNTATRLRTNTSPAYPIFATSTRARIVTYTARPSTATPPGTATFVRTPTFNKGGYPPLDETEALTGTPGEDGYPLTGTPPAGITPLATNTRDPNQPTDAAGLDGTPGPTATPQAPAQRVIFWGSLALGALLGTASLLAGGWYLFVRRSQQ